MLKLIKICIAFPWLNVRSQTILMKYGQALSVFLTALSDQIYWPYAAIRRSEWRASSSNLHSFPPPSSFASFSSLLSILKKCSESPLTLPGQLSLPTIRSSLCYLIRHPLILLVCSCMHSSCKASEINREKVIRKWWTFPLHTHPKRAPWPMTGLILPMKTRFSACALLNKKWNFALSRCRTSFNKVCPGRPKNTDSLST